jgi:hypothetical protein
MIYKAYLPTSSISTADRPWLFRSTIAYYWVSVGQGTIVSSIAHYGRSVVRLYKTV